MTTETKPLDIPSVGEQIEINRTINERIKAMRETSHKGGTRDKTVQSKGIQDYSTPADLMEAIWKFFGDIEFDLAASEENRKAQHYFGIQDDSLKQDWSARFQKLWFNSPSFFWLNPPFKTVRPWMEKCRDESAKGCRILSLTKASVGAQWYREVVAPHAMSYILGSRVTFEGEKQGFTQDLMITEWGTGKKGLGWWDWRKG